LRTREPAAGAEANADWYERLLMEQVTPAIAEHWIDEELPAGEVAARR